RRLRHGIEEEVDATSLMADDVILVRAGERLPADGVIVAGASAINESSITGEPLPREKSAGDEVFSGSLNGGGLLQIRVTRAGEETTIARVVQLVREARERPAPVERLADRWARYFLPALLLAAALTFYFTRDWMRTVAVLIVACPCALILATPTAMVAAMGGLARRGILVRGASVLQLAAKVDTVVFDKTGTITEGKFEILRLLPLNRTEDELLELAAAVERASDHPLARIVVWEATRRGLALEAEDATAAPGRGVAGMIGGRRVRAGNLDFVAEGGAAAPAAFLEQCESIGATAIWVAEDDRLAGAILLRDRIREGVRAATAGLGEIGIGRVLMLTGDRRRAAETIAREAGIAEVEAGLLPEQKLERVRQLLAEGRSVCMAGDGINDAPALAASTVGIAVAGASDITAEAADIVYLPHSLEKLPEVFTTSRRAVVTAWQNMILFAGLVNLAAVIFAARGTLGPIGAALTHQLSSFLVMLHSLRLLRVEGAWRRRLDPLWVRIRGAIPEINPAAPLYWVREHHRELRKPALIGAAAFILLNGFYVIPPEETGVVQRFGRKLQHDSGPGLHYKLPWPIDRLIRVQARRVRAIEIGFRSDADSPAAEPAVYEWNVQHRSGRFRKMPEESLMLTGDQNMIELNATVHYDVARPADFVFSQTDVETTVRSAAESAMQFVVTNTALDAVLTAGRLGIEDRIKQELQERLDRYACGVRVLGVRLEDVHPSLEVVDAFREVAGAFEEKNRMINEAEGYRNEQVALARGNGKAELQKAAGYTLDRIGRAQGDADRFNQHEAAFRLSPGPTTTRLYWETIEQVLPGKKKLIVDSSKARRHLFLIEDSVEVGGPALNPIFTQTPAKPPED
ncbi:MAG TPA: FtsH protease activity modulator HflK, partial [Candidatus Solibacter sp.]|nr:FtsH protease activity modulator HflK [Candidatus Solibacter sp.]